VKPFLLNVLILSSVTFAASNWPRFRGSDAVGIVEDPSLPDTWSATENVKWKTDIPGKGWSSPVVWGDRVFVTSVIRANSSYVPDRKLYSGTLDQVPPTDEHWRMIYCLVAWSLPQGGPYNVSPIVYGDHYYTLFDNGFITCHDAKTGKEIYSKRRVEEGGAHRFTTSLWAYNNKLFAMNEEGVTLVMQPGPEYKLLGKNSLEEMTLATPAIVRGSLLIRTGTKLYRIAK